MSRFHFSIKQKLQILDHREENKIASDIETSQRVTNRQIKQWSRQVEEYKKLSPLKQQKTFILHSGPKMKYAELYTFLYARVKEMREESQAISHNILINLAIQEDPEIRTLSNTGKRSLIDRFMKLFKLSIRTITTSQSSQDPEMSQSEEQTIENFRNEYFQTIRNFGIRPEDIFNMDQSSLFYETLPKKTIEIKGSKKVSVAAKGGQKKRATILSLINSLGEKFKQFVILKGTYNARIYEVVSQYNDDSNIFSTQENAWTDTQQLEDWLNNIWWPIAQSNERPKLLIVDSYPIHTDLKSELEKHNTTVLFIPKGLTKSLQPLDGLYHKAYKSFAREFWISNQSSLINTEAEWRMTLINCVKQIHSQITQETVISSWKMVRLECPQREEGSLAQEDSRMIIEDDQANREENREMEIEDNYDDENLFS